MIDLHTHSTFSDGTNTPEQLIALAQQAHLSAIALTDHNSIQGLPAFLTAAAHSDVEGVAGVEFSTQHQDTELHVVALFVPPQSYQSITQTVAAPKLEKQANNRKLLSLLRSQCGLDVSYEELLQDVAENVVNRAHISAYLMKKGIISSIEEGFSTFLHPDYGLYTPPSRLDTLDIIEQIHHWGAVSVLAHPLLNMSAQELSAFLPQAKERGLVAMETLYATYTPQDTATALTLARTFDLLPSGGSDYHGTIKPHITLGRGCGTLAVPEQVLDDLRKHIP